MDTKACPASAVFGQSLPGSEHAAMRPSHPSQAPSDAEIGDDTYAQNLLPPDGVAELRTLVTCHTNADFDAFASLVAAQFVYPGATLYFPGSQERTLQVFFADTACFMYNFKKTEDLDFQSFERLVVVDTRQRSRVPHVQELLDKPGVEIHLWDHHPNSTDDIPAKVSVVAALGSTTTLLLREIRGRNLNISCQDATVLGLGIYADTGSFTFSSTVAEDYMAAAWLRQQGMDVNSIADLAAHELTRAHVQALNALLESATSYAFGDTSVVIADASMESYLGDFAYLAHKLMEMERFDVLFALGRMEDRILIVARSRQKSINVGLVCAALGGGGHAYAASATVRDKTMTQVRDEIFQLLYTQANPDKHASDYMSSPAVGIEEHRSIKDAEELMLRFGLKAVPVFVKGTRHCVGILDSQTAARAVSHGLHALTLDIYMQRRIQTLEPTAALTDIMNIIVGARQRLVPVVQDEEVVGVVTRTDLINVFMEEPGGVPKPLRENSKERNVSKIMRDRLPKNCLDLLEKAGALGDKLGLPVYAVGGFVRDLLLEKQNQDIDLVVEGNGIAYARELAQMLGGRVREHKEFLTSVVIFEEKPGEERHIDVATARLEYYEYPAALPTVELSSIKMDLFRRDFTINSLAIRLEKNGFGKMVDFFGGQRDMRDKVIRVLHTLSFVEDPTRCLRAVRFEQRYRFRLSPSAEKLIKNALSLKLMDKLSGARLFHELKLIFEEADPVACLLRLNELGLLPAIHPKLALNPTKVELLRTLKDMLDWYRLLYFEDKPQRWFVYLLGLCRTLNYQETSAIFERLGLPQAHKPEALHLRERIRNTLPKVEAWQNGGGKVSQLCRILENMPLDGLLFMMGRTSIDQARMSISRYITVWSREKVDISGHDLMAMGLAPGPLFGQIMRRVMAAKLDGEATTPESQRILARALAFSKAIHKEQAAE